MTPLLSFVETQKEGELKYIPFEKVMMLKSSEDLDHVGMARDLLKNVRSVIQRGQTRFDKDNGKKLFSFPWYKSALYSGSRGSARSVKAFTVVEKDGRSRIERMLSHTKMLFIMANI